jgi:hypothetical protein
VYGVGAPGIGVYGISYSTGVRGEGTGTIGTGVYGAADAYGGHFVSDYPTGCGVYGHSTSTLFGTGVYGECEATWPDGYGVYYVGGLGGSGGKSCVVRTSQGPTLLYCQESPENWFEDFGEGSFAAGEATVRLDPLFSETVTIDSNHPMKVFIAPNQNIGAWWIEKGTDSFTVKAPDAAEGARFDYRVVAKRKGFETRRLDYCKAAEKDTYLYPELRETE